MQDLGAFLDFDTLDARSLDYVPGYQRELFGPQLAAFLSPAKQACWLTTRRAGKTTGLSRWHIDGMERYPGPEEWSGYLTLTKGQSKRNLEGELRALVARWGLPIKFGEPDGQFTLTHPNGHRFWIGGVDDLRKADRFRGNKWRRFSLDEAGAWPDAVMKYVIDDVIGPALTDNDGELRLAGTPGILPVGYFWEVTTEGDIRADGSRKMPKWETHEWSLLDNPFHPWGRFGREHGLAKLNEHRIRRGWEWDNPTLQREYLGRWAIDDNALIYRYDGARNHFDAGPWPGCLDRVIGAWGTDLRWVLGSDVGHNDATTFILTVSRPGYPHVLFLRAWGGSEMLTTQRAAELLRLRDELQKRGQRLSSTEMDPAGGGKMLAHDLQHTFGITVNPATKTDKASAARNLQAAMISGNALFNAVECQNLLGEMSVLPWNEDRTNHHDKYPDDFCDGAVYAHRKHPTREVWDHTPLIPGTPEAINLAAQLEKKKTAEVARVLASGQSNSRKQRELARMGWRTGRTGRRM